MTNPIKKFERASLSDSLAKIQEEKDKKHVFRKGSLLVVKSQQTLTPYREQSSIEALDVSKSVHMWFTPSRTYSGEIFKTGDKQCLLYLGYKSWAWDFHYIHFFLWENKIYYMFTKEMALRQFTLVKRPE